MYSCYSDYGPNCNTANTNDNSCAEVDGITLTNLTYCVSNNNQTCF